MRQRPPSPAPLPARDRDGSLVGILLNTSCDHFARIATGVMDYFSDHHGLRAVRIDLSRDPASDPIFLKELGGIVGDSIHTSWVNALDEMGKPFVFVSDKVHRQGGRPHSSILPDSSKIGSIAAEFWLHRAPASFAFVGWDASNYCNVRRSSFSRFLEGTGHRVHFLPELRCAPRLSPSAFRSYRDDLLAALHKLPKPCGLFAVNDYFGALVTRVATEGGISIPDELGILGVDNDKWISSEIEIPLTSIDLDSELIGHAAAALLTEAIRLGSRAAKQKYMPPRGILERASTGNPSVLDPTVERARRYMIEHLSDPIRIDDLMGHCHVSRSVLGRRFQDALKHSPRQELRSIRFAKAKELLRETDLTIDWVAEKCGFPSGPSFSSAFRSTHGIPPSQYRLVNRLRGEHGSAPTEVAARPHH